MMKQFTYLILRLFPQLLSFCIPLNNKYCISLITLNVFLSLEFYHLLINPIIFNCIFRINEMSSFKSKLTQVKQQISQQNHKCQQNTNNCSHQQIRIVKQASNNLKSSVKDQLSFQQPIIIEKKTVVKSENQVKKRKTTEFETHFQRKKVEPFMPINVPVREKKVSLENISMSTAPTANSNKQIEIQIEKDDKNKQCLKKLFKKIHKLSEDLQQSEKERIRLNLELQNYKNRSKICNDHERVISRLEADKYRFQAQIEILKKLLKQKDDQIARIGSRAPKEIIKEVIIQKPVQVIVEVPKHIMGPERIVQKIVEVPKYIEVEKKTPVQVIKQVPKEVIRTVQVPTIVEKPIYIDKPVYIDRPPVEIQKIVEVPIQVPVEYPVYIDRPVVEEEWINKIRHLQTELQALLKENAVIVHENNEYRIIIEQLEANIDVLRRHNEQKNREVQLLLQNSIDYLPVSPQQQEYSLGSVKYSISSNPHPRII